jgi:hypothetical protein
MDEKLYAFLCLAGGGGFFAVLGGVFGAVAGAMYWRRGRASGTAFGLGVARTFDRVSERELSPVVRGAVSGAADGVLFLGTLGILAGAFVAYGGWVETRWLGTIAWLSLFVVGAALFFGSLAYSLVGAGVRGLAPASGCGLLGAIGGAWLGGVSGLMVGLIAGIQAGAVIGLLRRRGPPDA